LSCVRQWKCSEWSACSNSQQSRTCQDEHGCNATKTYYGRVLPVYIVDKNPPALTQACAGGTAAQQTVATVPRAPPAAPAAVPAVQQPAGEFAQFWNSYKFIILSATAAILLALVILLVIQHRKGKHRTYNYAELKNWIAKERASGGSDEVIKKLIKQKTSWTRKEIEGMFTELGKK